MKRMAMALLGLAALAGCPEPDLCTSEVVVGIVVHVTDALSHADLCDATVILKNASGYEERPTAMGTPCQYAGAWEQPGTFSVEVSRSGYQVARRQGIAVTQDNCHVVTQDVKVELAPN